MIPKEFSLEAKIALLKKKAKDLGAEIKIDENIYDNEHLNCFWYGGYIGSIVYKNYMIDIEVQGEVRLTVLDEDGNELCEYVNKNNSGVTRFDEVYDVIKNDKHLVELGEKGLLYWSNNNWVEFFLRNKDGEDSGKVFDILDDNIVEAFDDIEDYIEIIEEHIAEGGH